jgi:DNA-binding NarL/FixJ family response regulator
VTTRKVLVADDHARTRGAVVAALNRSDCFEVCAEASTADGAVDTALETMPDLCLLDINMPGNGISAAARISALLPSVAIVMLTVSRQDTDLFDALRAGASGYLLKDLSEERLVEDLQRVLDGEACLPGTLVVKLVDEFRSREERKIQMNKDRAVKLTTREWEVLKLMRSGAGSVEIASELSISVSTVRSHVSAILRKLRVKNRRAVLDRLDDPSRVDQPFFDAAITAEVPA